MSTRPTKLAASLAFLAMLALADSERPALKEAPARLVTCIESTARADRAAACVNLTSDATQKRLRIYAVSLGASTGKFKEGDYDIEVIYNNEMAVEGKTAAGAYHHQHNQLVLTFAAARLASGENGLGLRLIRLLAAAQPDLLWSSPAHSSIPIQKILTGIEKEEEYIKEFLKEAAQDWEYTLKLYGP